jgi:hypothetical protein
MVTATFFCLGLAVCIFAGLVCFAMGKCAKKALAVQLPPNERAAWNRLKIAIMELYSRYESMETPKQRALRSWTGTLVICAGLCMIGIVLEVRFNSAISARTVVSNLMGEKQLKQLSPQQLQRYSPGRIQSKPAPEAARS